MICWVYKYEIVLMKSERCLLYLLFNALVDITRFSLATDIFRMCQKFLVASVRKV